MFVLGIFLFIQQAFAGSPETDSGWTLDACVQQALANSPAATIARQSEQSALEDVGAAKGRYFPDVSARAGYRRWETFIFLPQGVAPPGVPPIVGPVNEWRGNFRAEYTVFDSGRRSSEVKSAKSLNSAAHENSNRTKSEITFDVQSAFYELLAAQDQVVLAQARLERSQSHFRLASERKAAGAVPRADVTRASVDVSTAELDLVHTQSTERIARGHLNEVMGRMAQEPLDIARIEAEPPSPEGTEVQQSLAQAWGKRPEVLAAQHEVEAAQSRVGAVRSEILPRVLAEGGYGKLDEDFLPTNPDWYVGVNVTIPLFDGGTRKHRIAKSRVDVSLEQAQLEQIKLSVQQEIWSAYSKWTEAYQSLQTNISRKAEAEETMTLSKARYEEGADTINDLLDAEVALDQAETGLNNARYQLYIAHASFLFAAGEL
jgi:outer membrane protein